MIKMYDQIRLIHYQSTLGAKFTINYLKIKYYEYIHVMRQQSYNSYYASRYKVLCIQYYRFSQFIVGELYYLINYNTDIVKTLVVKTFTKNSNDKGKY